MKGVFNRGGLNDIILNQLSKTHFLVKTFSYLFKKLKFSYLDVKQKEKIISSVKFTIVAKNNFK